MDATAIILLVVGGIILIFIAIAFFVNVSRPDPGDDVNDDDNSDGGFDPHIGGGL